MTDETYGKRICERMNVCVCKTESHCGTEEIIILSINYTSVKLEKKLEKKNETEAQRDRVLGMVWRTALSTGLGGPKAGLHFWILSIIYAFVYCLFPPLECKFSEGQDFCLFLSLLHLPC